MQTVSHATISFYITTHGFLTRVYSSTQKISKHSEHAVPLAVRLPPGCRKFENLMLKRLLTNGLIPAYGELTTELIDERDCRFPDPRTDGLPTVCSAPSKLNVCICVCMCVCMYVAVYEISKHPENANCIARNNHLLCHNSWFPHPCAGCLLTIGKYPSTQKNVVPRAVHLPPG